MPSWGSSCKSSREQICPGAMSRGVRGARWTQIDAIARADVPCRPLEWRLPCQMNCRKAWNRALTAVRAVRRSSSKSSRELMCPGAMTGGVCCARWTQIGATARADVPCRPLEWRLPCRMVCRKRGTLGMNGLVCQVGVLHANHRARECALERCLEGFAVLDGHKLTPSRERMCPGGP